MRDAAISRCAAANETLPVPSFTGCRTLTDIPLNEVRELINWVYFFNLWRVKRGTPEAEALQYEAEALLDDLQTRQTLRGQVAFYPA